MTHTEEGTVGELFHKLQTGVIPFDAKARIVWEEIDGIEAQETAPQTLKEVLESARQKYSVNRSATIERLSRLDADREKTLAMFEQWRQEDALKTPEQQAEEARMYAEIERDGIPRFNIPDRISGVND